MADRRIIVAAVLLPVVAVGAILFYFDPGQHSFYPICLFHQTTGLLCAGCGASRALYHLLHGHLATAFRFNPLLIASLPCIGWFGARLLVRRWKDQPASASIRPVWLWLILVVLVVFTVARNLPGLPLAMRLPEPSSSADLRTAR
jgi:hypothetical protein